MSSHRRLSQRLPELTEEDSDLSLFFFQTGKSSFDGHKPVMIIQTHKIIAKKGGIGLLNMLSYKDGRHGEIHMELDFTLFPQEVVRAFFRLLYYDKLQKKTLPPFLLNPIVENPLVYHQLSLYFQFEALEYFLTSLIYEQFSAENFAYILSYCYYTEKDATVPYEKHRLYRKLLQWSQLCYPSLLLQVKGTPVNNFLLPEEGVFSEGRFTRLQCYRRICSSCLRRGTVTINDTRQTSLGQFHSGESRWILTLAQDLRESSQFIYSLWLKRVIPEKPPNSLEKCSLHSRLRLFSTSPLSPEPEEKREFEISQTSLQYNREVARFLLHSQDQCYETQCNLCSKTTLVYILDIRLELENLEVWTSFL